MEEFIKILTEQIRCVRAREGIAQEISNHILDQTEAFEQKGMSHEQALERAVQEMEILWRLGFLWTKSIGHRLIGK